MKKFIVKSGFFVLPFFVLHILNSFVYRQDEGDLVRLGYLYSNPCPKGEIHEQYSLERRYNSLKELSLSDTSSFDVITIGDSFSDQDSLGYNNFLAQKGLSVLNFDQHVIDINPIQALIQLLNSTFFDTVETRYIVLQSAERHFVPRFDNLDFGKDISLNSLSTKIADFKKKEPDYYNAFFSNTTLKIPLINLQYLFSNKPKESRTYKFPSNNEKLFSNSPENLLFYDEDISTLDIKNDSNAILNCVSVLDSISALLAEKNIQLITLVSPDKYDIYYPYIANNASLVKPMFFSIYEKSKKNYINIDSYRILSDKIKEDPNVYYYDDTHWSPIGAGVVADKIYEVVTSRYNM